MRLGIFLCCAAACAGDVSGYWTGQIQTGRAGALQDIAFQLIQQGSEIRGKLYGDYLSGQIVEGRAEGGEIWFVVIAPEQAGNQINQARLRFSGCVENDELKLTRTRESSAAAVSGAAATQIRPAPPIDFQVKRLVPLRTP
jgi:hypothetical protein